MERPDELAGAHVIPADITARGLLVGRQLIRGDVLDERADDDHVSHDDRGRVPVEVWKWAHQTESQVDFTSLTELGVPLAGTRVE